MHLFSPDFLHHLIETYGLWVLFCVVLLECMGIPMPGETALVSTALYAGSSRPGRQGAYSFPELPVLWQ